MNFDSLQLFATAAFGLEGAVSGELKRLGMKDVTPDVGGVRFSGSVSDAFLCNLRLRFADRVMIVLAEADCFSFEDLFQLVLRVPWEELMTPDAQINISGKCAKSRLMSIRDCQSVSKKAVIERMKRKTGAAVFPENGTACPIHFSIHNDRVRLFLDTSGEGLSRRGYRTWNGEAPIRETLAAALIEFSPWRPGMPLHDPCCGTGTLLVEAAFREGHRAPGLHRSFAMEEYPFYSKKDASLLREKTKSEFEIDRIRDISGSDIDPEALSLAGRHVRQAGLEGHISLEQADLRTLTVPGENGVFLCNPPYGERLSDQKSCHELYRELRLLKERHPGWALCAISSDPAFERAYGKRADKRRRLYNGRLECTFYSYFA